MRSSDYLTRLDNEDCEERTEDDMEDILETKYGVDHGMDF